MAKKSIENLQDVIRNNLCSEILKFFLFSIKINKKSKILFEFENFYGGNLDKLISKDKSTISNRLILMSNLGLFSVETKEGKKITNELIRKKIKGRDYGE